jgi:hypothetical protein
MTVLIYVNTRKQVGDPDHLKVFANQDAAETWFEGRGGKCRRLLAIRDIILIFSTRAFLV